MHDNERSLPYSVWIAYFSLNVVGVLVGLLSGAGLISGAGLGIFILGSLAIFIPWAVWKIDSKDLMETDSYKKGREEDQPG